MGGDKDLDPGNESVAPLRWEGVGDELDRRVLFFYVLLSFHGALGQRRMTMRSVA